MEWSETPQQIKLKRTQRGFLRGDFSDTYGTECSIQESSSATAPRLWLGASTRMHLSQEQVKALLPHLQAFVKHGRLIRDIRDDVSANLVKYYLEQREAGLLNESENNDEYSVDNKQDI